MKEVLRAYFARLCSPPCAADVSYGLFAEVFNDELRDRTATLQERVAVRERQSRGGRTLSARAMIVWAAARSALNRLATRKRHVLCSCNSSVMRGGSSPK